MYQAEFKVKVQGLFSFEVRKADTGEVVKSTGQFPNVVLDQGLELIGYGGALDFCQVGSGVTTPSKTDSQLESFIAETSSVPDNHKYPYHGVNADEGFVWVRKIFRFNQGQATGNISEVGVGGGAGGKGGKKLFNRSLVRDAQGLFATVTVMEDETLDVTVELRSYLDQNTQQYTVNMSSVNYGLRTEPVYEDFSSGSSTTFFTSRVFQHHPTAYSGGIQSRLGRPSAVVAGFTGQGASYSTREYVSGSKEQVMDMYWGLNAGNGAPTRTVVVPTNIGCYQTEFNPVIPKTSDHILKLTFKISWDRYE